MEKYRTFFPRFVAWLIDGFIMLPIGILDDWFRQAEFQPLFFYIWIPLSMLVSPGYRILMHASGGQTLGKMAMNVKVLSVTEEPVRFIQAILRETPQLIINIGVSYLLIAIFPQTPEAENLKPSYNVFVTFVAGWSLANILVFLFNDKRRALHDFLAGTVVVRTDI